VQLAGDVGGLTELRDCLVEASTKGRAQLDVEGPEGRQRLHVFLGVTGLLALPLPTGVLIYGDGDALSDALRGIDYCIQTSAGAAPLDGYHHHVELFNELDASFSERVGELTIHWVAAPGEVTH
jgi:hypothetical protein